MALLLSCLLQLDQSSTTWYDFRGAWVLLLFLEFYHSWPFFFFALRLSRNSAFLPWKWLFMMSCQSSAHQYELVDHIISSEKIHLEEGEGKKVGRQREDGRGRSEERPKDNAFLPHCLESQTSLCKVPGYLQQLGHDANDTLIVNRICDNMLSGT